jgi:phosphoglycerate dehydrogenase-like enzyme
VRQAAPPSGHDDAVTAPTRVLVLHDRPDELRSTLAPLAADLAWAAAPAEVGRALAAHAPEAVLSIKHSAFPGPAHTPAARHPSVRWLHVGGSGYEHFAPLPEGLVVTNCAGVLAPCLAETALAALLSLAVGLPRYAEQQRQQRWVPHRFDALAGRRLLIVGAGAVGQALGQRAAALGMEVVGVRRTGREAPGFAAMHTPDALPALLPTADVVSVHVRLDASTERLFDAAAFAAMKPGALFLNSARGLVVDTDALLDARHLGGVWLDVVDPEPLPSGHPLWTVPNTLITPHAADQVADFPRRFAERFAENLRRWRAGEPLVGRIA